MANAFYPNESKTEKALGMPFFSRIHEIQLEAKQICEA